MILPWDKDCTPTEERSRFNKVEMLLMALRLQKYDELLLLDADTIIYDFDYDISEMLNDTKMLVAQRTKQEDPPTTSSINNGVTLWNLTHPFTKKVAYKWDTACRKGLPDNRPFRGDQYYLRKVLKEDPQIPETISGVWDEFYYRDASIIKHFQRSNPRSWNDTGLDTREQRILNVTTKICSRYRLDPGLLDMKNYTAESGNRVKNETACQPKRKLRWEMIRYSEDGTTPASKRLLVAQYTSYGSYASLMELSSPINTAYARKWNHDTLIVQGSALTVNTDPEGCDLPAFRAMYNKIPILIFALQNADLYDQVLILDADSMIYNFEFDLTSLAHDNDMLVAQRVAQEDSERTWNINNGIALWNLRHEMTRKLAMKWFSKTTEGLKNGLLHSDQHYLHMLLKREGYGRYIRGLKEEFRYEKATVVKHFVRANNSDWTGYHKGNREQKLINAVNEVCGKYPGDCEDLEQVPYSTI